MTSCDYLRSFDGVYHQQPSHMPDAPGSPQPETSDRSPNYSRIRGNRCPLKENSIVNLKSVKLMQKLAVQHTHIHKTDQIVGK